jgi:hypothetical protein
MNKISIITDFETSQRDVVSFAYGIYKDVVMVAVNEDKELPETVVCEIIKYLTDKHYFPVTVLSKDSRFACNGIDLRFLTLLASGLNVVDNFNENLKTVTDYVNVSWEIVSDSLC